MDRVQSNGWSGDFSYDFYRTLLRSLQSRFEVRTLSEYPDCRSSNEPIAFVRHDVDVCLDEAVTMAQVEYQLGISSTYMILPETSLYDLEAKRDSLITIQDFGHEIGLHCDLDSEPSDSRNGTNSVGSGLLPEERTQIEAARNRLESIGVGPIESLSFHQPTERLLGGPPTVAGMVNAYSSELLSSYISDSRGRWREGSPIRTVSTASDVDTFQLLTHPVWWTHDHEPPLERLSTVAKRIDVTNERIYDELVSIYPAFADRIEQLKS
ncbi:polysaccharide deacetylase family protein [Natronorubrum halophilum]|uniref:hypothetical protein n=1 Tax=Natronorubrum halophilum TaxID=1702106 RepID=UPI000EF6D706|nr:hypothetical protein [Natronorubrum halophilum]